MNGEVLQRLSETLLSRRNADPETSYTAQLLAKGPDAILKKIGEETAELIMTDLEGNESRNITTLSGCREYTGESVLRFDEPTDTPPPPGPAATGSSCTPAPTPTPPTPAFGRPSGSGSSPPRPRPRRPGSPSTRDTG